MKRRAEVLGNHGAYDDAKQIKKKMKEYQKIEKEKQTQTGKEKLFHRG